MGRFSKDHDICTEASYAYEAKGGKCRSSSCTVGMTSGTVTGVKSVAPLIGNAKDADLKSALAVQPLSIAIEADQDIFQHYKSGTITGNCGTSTDHGVLLVGYGTDSDGNDYWEVKNSWGILNNLIFIFISIEYLISICIVLNFFVKRCQLGRQWLCSLGA